MAFPPKADDKGADKKDGDKSPFGGKGKAPPFGQNRGKAKAKDVVKAARGGDTGAKASLSLRKKDGEDDDSFYKSMEASDEEMDMGEMLDDVSPMGGSDKEQQVADIIDGPGDSMQKAKDICTLFKASDEP